MNETEIILIGRGLINKIIVCTELLFKVDFFI